nr:hypothetical protein [Streptomyces sp. FT05W]
MPLHTRKIDRVPEETARVAWSAFPKGSLAMRIRDELGEPFTDEDFLGPCLLDHLLLRLRAEGDPAAHVRLVVGTGKAPRSGRSSTHTGPV